MKTVCQITMFRVFNYGSALQTYALSTAIDNLPGYRCITIDYAAQSNTNANIRSPQDILRKLFSTVLYWRRTRLYNHFLREELKLTPPYASYEELRANPPRSDVYVTGSDQTFNPQWSGSDPAYFLGFVPAVRRSAIKKISYASSFAVNRLPNTVVETYRKALSDYDALSVREESGTKIIRELLNRPAAWCCDPTLLLTREMWQVMAQKAVRKVRKPYILVYIMAYMVNPYPQADRIIAEAQKAFGNMHIIYLCGRKTDLGKPNATIIKNASPYEFVDLFLNASLIITSSFHGVVFSLHSKAPFIALTESDERKDTRLRSLLHRIGATKHIIPVPVPDDIHITHTKRWKQDDYSQAIDAWRTESLQWLRDALAD